MAEGPGDAVAAARPLALGGEEAGFWWCEDAERMREGWGACRSRFGGEGNTPASTKLGRRSLDCAMPMLAWSRACQKQHGCVSLHTGLQSKNLFATRCKGTRGATLMKKVFADWKLGLYKKFKVLFWPENKIGFWGFNNVGFGWFWMSWGRGVQRDLIQANSQK